MLFDLRTYTIRRKIFTILDAKFHVYDTDGRVVGFSRQKAFKLKEDIRVYRDEEMSEQLLAINARQIIDWSAAYDIVDARTGEKVGAARRKGWSSMVRDSWELLDEQDRPIGHLQEDSTAMALVRRFLSNLVPQTFHLRNEEGRDQALLRVHFNPFVYRLTVLLEEHCAVDPRLVFGTAVLLAAIEGRQSGN